MSAGKLKRSTIREEHVERRLRTVLVGSAAIFLVVIGTLVLTG